MGLVSSLNVVEESEVLTSLVDGEDVHESARESGVSSDSVIDLDETFSILDDFLDLSSVESVSESVLENKAERDAFSELVGTSGWSGSLYNKSDTVDRRDGGGLGVEG